MSQMAGILDCDFERIARHNDLIVIQRGSEVWLGTSGNSLSFWGAAFTANESGSKLPHPSIQIIIVQCFFDPVILVAGAAAPRHFASWLGPVSTYSSGYCIG